ncbi:MAG: VOC family protein [Alphaproteobacteria bacterium]|nr:MAG: VOC family protein [Alphaproteobacteria bacterium]
MSPLVFDHLAVAAETLEEGAAEVSATLGVPLAPGGRHPAMGTHNRLLSLGEAEYLEVIAIDPEAIPPARARWFGLDGFEGLPRPVGWVLRTDDLDAALGLAPEGIGAPMELTRGDLHWRLTVPESGVTPFDGLFPALIEWEEGEHPARGLPASGCTLERLELFHPAAEALAEALAPLTEEARIHVHHGPVAQMRAVIATPHGPRVLGP